MMKKGLMITGSVILALLIGAAIWIIFFWQPGPSYESVAYLKSPEIITLPDELMMTITLTGDPSEIAGEGISTLYSAWMKAGGQWGNDVAPRGRWGSVEEFDGTESLTGTFGLPMPAGVTTLPEGLDGRVKIETWNYGTVAQILHVGSYDSEQPTIDQLREFILAQGYDISGEHEEVYLKGPNMFGYGNADKFLTIIRYPVSSN